jgi:predicted nucleotidyltransferase
MEKTELINELNGLKAELRRRGVVSLALFGSRVRGEGRPGSDVDLLVEFSRPVSLFDFFRLQHWLEEALGVDKVDLVEREALHPALKESILAESVHVA